MVRFYLNTFLVVADACKGVNHKWEVVKVRTTPKHQSTHILNYQSSKTNQTNMIKVTRQNTRVPSRTLCLLLETILAHPLLQKDWATLLHFIYCYRYLLVTTYLAIKLSVTYNFSACKNYLAKNRLSFPSSPRWVQQSYLSKGLQLIPYTCGSSRALWPFAPMPQVCASELLTCQSLSIPRLMYTANS